MRPRAYYEVEWIDIVGETGWRTEAAVAERGLPQPCASVGVLVSKTAKQIILAGSYANDGDVLQTIIIPMGCVRRIRRLSRTHSRPRRTRRYGRP